MNGIFLELHKATGCPDIVAAEISDARHVPQWEAIKFHCLSLLFSPLSGRALPDKIQYGRVDMDENSL